MKAIKAHVNAFAQIKVHAGDKGTKSGVIVNIEKGIIFGSTSEINDNEISTSHRM